MDFEEYMTTTGMEEQTENSCAWEFYKEIYKAGQQSRQSEIDELQKRVKELELINFDSELHFDAAKEHIDHLQKRIDLALEKCYTGIRKQGGDYYLEVVQAILKGEKQ